MAQLVKNPPTSEGGSRDSGSISGWGRSLGEGNGNALQCSFLENSMDRGAWRATVHGVAKNWTQLSVHKHTHTHTHTHETRILKRNGKEGNQSEGLRFCFVLFFSFR